MSAMSVLAVEITTVSRRAFFGAFFTLFHCGLRLFHAFIAVYVKYWMYLHLIIMIPSFLGLFLFIWILESPRWSVSQNKEKQAIREFYKAYRINHLYKKGCRLTKEEFFDKTGYPELEGLSKEEVKDSFDCNVNLRHIGSGLAAPYQNGKNAKKSVISTMIFAGQMCVLFGLLFYIQVVRFKVHYAAMINAATAILGIAISTIINSKLKSLKKPLMAIYGVAAVTLLTSGFYTVFAKPESEIPLMACCNIGLVLVGAAVNIALCVHSGITSILYSLAVFWIRSGFGKIGAMICSFVNRLDDKLGHGVPVIIYGGVLLLQVVLNFFSD